MNLDQFVVRCPSLWHVGPVGAWDGVQRDGFRTAAQLIDASDLDAAAKQQMLVEPRAEPVTLHVNRRDVVLRDQGPLFARKDLGSILGDGMTPGDWVQLLNRRVYLFADRAAMLRLRDKYVGRDGAQEVFTFSPRRLFESCRGRLELTMQNTGAVPRRVGVHKTWDTFVPVALFADRRPVEVTVRDGFDDLDAVAFVERWFADGTRERLVRG